MPVVRNGTVLVTEPQGPAYVLTSEVNSLGNWEMPVGLR
jgi:hypothetical protein